MVLGRSSSGSAVLSRSEATDDKPDNQRLSVCRGMGINSIPLGGAASMASAQSSGAKSSSAVRHATAASVARFSPCR